MPKRKRSDNKRHIERKIKRLKARLNQYSSSESSSDEESQRTYYQSHERTEETAPTSPSPSHNISGEILDLTDSDCSLPPGAPSMRSAVICGPSNSLPEPQSQPGPSTSSDATTTLAPDILEALGDPKGKEEIFGPSIPVEIAERWGRILVNGLTKEQRQQMTEKYLIPENFRLAKAPLLNPEIFSVLQESAKNRDKLMEKSQNQLGLGIAELTNLTTAVIQGETDKIQLLKKITDISQILLDLHHEETKRRRRLITGSLDKKFIHMVSDVPRDSFLFGSNLGEKIKASKTAERSGLQLKRKEPAAAKKYPQPQSSGNWRGPPRGQVHRNYKQGGQKNKYQAQYSQRPRQAADRPQRVSAKNTNKKSQ